MTANIKINKKEALLLFPYKGKTMRFIRFRFEVHTVHTKEA